MFLYLDGPKHIVSRFATACHDFAKNKYNPVLVNPQEFVKPSLYMELLKFGVRNDVLVILAGGWLRYTQSFPEAGWKNEILFSLPAKAFGKSFILLPPETDNDIYDAEYFRHVAKKYNYEVMRQLDPEYAINAALENYSYPMPPTYSGSKHPNLLFFSSPMKGTEFEWPPFTQKPLIGYVKKYLDLIDDCNWNIALADTRAHLNLEVIDLKKTRIICFGNSAKRIIEKLGYYPHTVYAMPRIEKRPYPDFGEPKISY
jgi:hypothetical protein